MPYLSLNTNQVIPSAHSEDLMHRLSGILAQNTGKPETYVMIHLHDGQPMLFAGTNAPLAYLDCKSIGLSKAQAKSLSAALSQALEQCLHIPPDRIYIEFSNCEAAFWGWNGSTFG